MFIVTWSVPSEGDKYQWFSTGQECREFIEKEFSPRQIKSYQVEIKEVENVRNVSISEIETGGKKPNSWDGIDDVELVARSLCVDDDKTPDEIKDPGFPFSPYPVWKEYEVRAVGVLESLALADRYHSPALKDQ